MIVRPTHNWFRLLFTWNGSVLLSIMPQLCFMAVISCLAVFTHGRIFGEKIPLNSSLITLFGLALTIFLAFRNNASYDRYKEARVLWGGVLIAARALTEQILCYLPEQVTEQQRNEVVNSLIAFVYALRHQLRKIDPRADFVRLLGERRADELCRKAFPATAILYDMRVDLHRMQGLAPAGCAETNRWMFDAQLNDLAKALGGCERIASTPIPFAYSVLLHRTVYAYCLMLPFGLVDATEFFTPLLCVFFAYTLIALEAIASEVAEPFSMAPNALALDSMTRNIERTVLELCDRPIPEPTKPMRPYQLM